jgi:hypothetical protein
MLGFGINTIKGLFILAIIVIAVQSCDEKNKLPSRADLPHATLTTTAPEGAVR